MRTSESLKAFMPCFLAAQKAMGAAKKDAKNAHFNSRYADLAAVVEAVKGPLNEQGISILQMARATDGGIEVETILWHSSTEFIAETLSLPVTKTDAQGCGSAITYARRYGLQSICGVPSDDDDGNAAAAATSNNMRRPQPSSAKGGVAKLAEKLGVGEKPKPEEGSPLTPEAESRDEKAKRFAAAAREAIGPWPKIQAWIASEADGHLVTNLSELSEKDLDRLLDLLHAQR